MGDMDKEEAEEGDPEQEDGGIAASVRHTFRSFSVAGQALSIAGQSSIFLPASFGRSSKGSGQSRRTAFGGIIENRDRTVHVLKSRRRTMQSDAMSADASPLGHDRDTVPISAYSALCPVEYLCGIESRRLPCGETSFVQSVFGNGTDIATAGNRKVEHAEDEPVEPGVMLGFPSIVDMGWEPVDAPRAIRQLETRGEVDCFTLACAVLGAQFVHKQGDDSDKLQVSFFKGEVPGSLRVVKERLRKLRALDHINLAQLVEVCEDEETIHLVYEAPEGLGYLVHRALNTQNCLGPPEAAKVCQQAAAAVAACHRANVHHLDWSLWSLAPHGYGSLFPLKVFGAGLAGVLHAGRSACSGGHDEALWVARGPFYYWPPEVCRLVGEGGQTGVPLQKIDGGMRGPVDIWGLGAVVYTAVAGHHPFPGADCDAVVRCCLEKRPSWGHGFSDMDRSGMDLVEGMLQKDPKQRPKAEDVVSNGWVVQHVRAAEDKGHIERVAQRMRDFATLGPAMRALAQVLRGRIRVDKLRSLEALFHALDVRGDGHIEPHELGAHLADRGADLKSTFGGLGLQLPGAINLDEFVVVNVFGQEVLTERMLMRTFEYLDLDGTGDITAVELYAALRRVNPNLRPEDVGELMGTGDRDWEADMDFKEFRGFFPQVIGSAAGLRERLELAAADHGVAGVALRMFRDECVQWRSDLAEQSVRATKARGLALRDEKFSQVDEWIKEMQAVLKKTMICFRSPPASKLPKTEEGLRVQREEEEFKRQRLKASRRSAEAAAAADGAGTLSEAVGTPPADEFDGIFGGPRHLDSFVKKAKNGWITRLTAIMSSAKYAAATHNKHRKRQDSVALLDDLTTLITDVSMVCETCVEEQTDVLEAAEPEDPIPRAPAARRGLVVTDVEEAAAQVEIDRFRAGQVAVADEARRQAEHRDAQKEVLRKTDLGGELRGFQWLERQLKRSEKSGRRPPDAARLMEDIVQRAASASPAAAGAPAPVGGDG